MHVHVVMAIFVAAVSTLAADEPSRNKRSIQFDTDAKWESFRNRLAPESRNVVRQRFGFRESNLAGGIEPGEIGGRVHRDHTRATYAKKITPKTLDDRLSVSGTFSVTDDEGSAGVLIGWFNDKLSQGWRTPHSLAMRIDGNGGKFWVFFEYGTGRWGTHGGGAFEGTRYQTTPTKPFRADGTPHRFQLIYDPGGADGKGQITFRCDQKTWELPLLKGHRQQGAAFDRFGIWNQQTAGNSLQLFVDDLVINGEHQAFDTDPSWIGSGNTAEYRQRVVRPFHDFGFSPTNHAGGELGEMGGIFFRDEAPAYYADRIGRKTLDDELFASGKIVMRSAGADSGVMLGWFDGDRKRKKYTPQHQQPQTDLLGVVIEGPSRVGHYFRAAYSTSHGTYRAPTLEGTDRQRPILLPNDAVHEWSIHYRPLINSGHGQIDVRFDGKKHSLPLEPGHRAENARFDRFGIFNIQDGGHHVELYLDDLIYTN